MRLVLSLLFAACLWPTSTVCLADTLNRPRANETQTIASSQYAIDAVRAAHSDESPTIVVQNELDKLVDKDGGRACPLSAGLIADQVVRVMASVPMDQQPHRAAMRIFQRRPELKEGRITNDRFVRLIQDLAAETDGFGLEVDVVSARNSKHAKEADA